MKKYLCILLLPLLAMGFAAGAAHGLPATFEVYNASAVLGGPIYLGEDFTVDVYAQGLEAWGDLASFGFDVDPLDSLTLFSFEGYSLGADYDDITMPSDPENYLAGLYWPADPLLDSNAGEDVLLASLSFATIGIGTDTLNVGSDLILPFSHGLFYEFFDQNIIGSVDIEILESQTASVPEPATILLLAAGLAGLGVLGRKRHKGTGY